MLHAAHSHPSTRVAATAPPTTSPAADASGEMHGNKNTKVYHLPGCPGYKVMRQTNLVTFASEAEAQQAGYRKAKNCP